MRTIGTWCRGLGIGFAATLVGGGCYEGIDETVKVTPRVQATSEAVCEVTVAGVGTLDLETEYLPRVVHCENGGANFEALKAQAIAARSVAYHAMRTHGQICDGQGCQVYSCGSEPTEEQRRAVAETAGQVLTYNGQLTYAFYVAGDSNTAPPACFGDAGVGTERFVTDNTDAIGDQVEQTQLGWIFDPADAGYGTNRGCMSQWGARCLENNFGYTAEQILQRYYGADIEIMQAAGACVDGSLPLPTPEPEPLPPPSCDPLLEVNEVLFADEHIRSCNGLFTLWMQGDGNVVLYEDASGRPLWNSRTVGTVDPALVMQGDGNFVLYDGSGTPMWHTQTHGNDGAILHVTNDGNLVVSKDGHALWRAR